MPPRVPIYWEDVTPADGTTFPNPSVGLYVEGAGNLAFAGNGGGTVTLTAVAAKSYVWCDVRKVLSTGTTATGIRRMVG